MKAFIVLFFVLLVCGIDLKFKDGRFRIMQVTDTHYADYDSEDEATTKFLDDILSFENPDMVVITGDLVSGYKYNGTVGWYKSYWEKATQVYVDHHIPYALVLGNHDSEADLSRKEVMKLDMTNPLSVSNVCSDDIPGGSNYYIPIYDSKFGTNVTFNLWFFDSMYKNCSGIYGYGCVSFEAVEWYYHKSIDLEKKNGKLGSLSFMHIPPPEMMTAWNERYPVIGEKNEVNSCSSANSGLVNAMLTRKDVTGLFFGHDHRNNYDINFNGLHMVYGGKTGYGNYAPDPWKEHNVRMIEIDEESGSWTSYLRTISHQRIDQVDMKWTNGTQYKCNI